MTRPRKDVVRIEMPRATDEMIQARVHPLLPREVFIYWNHHLIAAVVRAAYLQGALDALTITEHHPELIAMVKASP